MRCRVQRTLAAFNLGSDFSTSELIGLMLIIFPAAAKRYCRSCQHESSMRKRVGLSLLLASRYRLLHFVFLGLALLCQILSIHVVLREKQKGRWAVTASFGQCRHMSAPYLVVAVTPLLCLCLLIDHLLLVLVRPATATSRLPRVIHTVESGHGAMGWWAKRQGRPWLLRECLRAQSPCRRCCEVFLWR